MPPPPPPRAWEKPTLFVFGALFLIALLALIRPDSHPSHSSWFIYTIVLALAAGAVTALLPGTINVTVNNVKNDNWSWKPQIRASGAIAVVVIVICLGTEVGKEVATEDTFVPNLKSHLESPQGTGIDPSSDVYVVINSKLAAYSKGHQSATQLDFGKSTWNGVKKASILRGSGGIQVNYGALAQGDKIDIISIDTHGLWWLSNDMTVPEGELEMKSTTMDNVKAEFIP
jgi:hypothetical protein